MTAFTPRHTQPFTLDQAMLLEVDMLVAEVSRLQNSLTHLGRTQAELQSFINDPEGGDEDGELLKAVQENDNTIASQTERIELIKIALLNKVGEGGMRHMGLTLGDKDVEGKPVEAVAETTREAGPVLARQEGDGLHL